MGQDKLAQVVELLREAAQPKRIFLFGSHARGDANEDSDVDILVVEKDVPDRVAEMVRLCRVLSPTRVAVDLLVVSEKMFELWCDTPGNVYFEAGTMGRVLYEAPGSGPVAAQESRRG